MEFFHIHPNKFFALRAFDFYFLQLTHNIKQSGITIIAAIFNISNHGIILPKKWSLV